MSAIDIQNTFSQKVSQPFVTSNDSDLQITRGTLNGDIDYNANPNGKNTFDKRLGTLNGTTLTLNYNYDTNVIVPPKDKQDGPVTLDVDIGEIFPSTFHYPDGGLSFDGEYTATGSDFNKHISGSSSVYHPGSSYLGGPITFEFENIIVFQSFNEYTEVSGTFSDQSLVSVDQNYTPKSVDDYIRDVLIADRKGTDYDTAVEAFNDIISLRESDSATSSQNLNLRDAEYFLRGYAGGLADRQFPAFNENLYSLSGFPGTLRDELGNRGGPLAWVAYSTIKALKNFFVGSVGPNGLTSSPIGGFYPNLNGFIKGFMQKSVDDLLSQSSIDSSGTSREVPALSVKNFDSQGQASDASKPLQPNASLDNGTSTTALFDVNITNVVQPVFFDPAPSRTHVIIVDGNTVSQMIIPDSLGDGPFQITAQGKTFDLNGGSTFDFHGMGLANVTAITVEAPISQQNFDFGLIFDHMAQTVVADAFNDQNTTNAGSISEPTAVSTSISAPTSLPAVSVPLTSTPSLMQLPPLIVIPTLTPSMTDVPTDFNRVTISPQVTYTKHAFIIKGVVSNGADVRSVEISAQVDGVQTDLGAAAVAADGSFTFSDRISRHTQSFITATEIDNAGGTASSGAPYSLESKQPGSRAEQNIYSADGSALLLSTRFAASGRRFVGVESPGQTIDLQPFDIVSNCHQGSTTFMFSQGDGLDVIGGFKLGAADHDTLVLPSTDFRNFADVLRNTGDVGGSAFITDPKTGDALRLAGVTTAELKQHPGDFTLG